MVYITVQRGGLYHHATAQVSNSMQTQTYVENVAIATMVDMEEGLTKTVTLSPQETATITKEQLAKIQVLLIVHCVIY